MGSLSPAHWLVVLIVAALLFFGWKQLPDMARSLGRSLRIFKTELKGMADDDTAREAQRTGGTSGSTLNAEPNTSATPLPNTSNGGHLTGPDPAERAGEADVNRNDGVRGTPRPSDTTTPRDTEARPTSGG
jgi:sec-independent protein translocase protein TatA